MPYIGNIVQDFSVNNAMLNTDSVTSIKVLDGTLVNADINDSAAIDATKLSFTQTGTGAVARTVDSKLEDVVNVADFGAIGNGTNNDTTAIQAAIDSLGNNGGVVEFNVGTFLINATLTLTKKVHLVGKGGYFLNQFVDNQFTVGGTTIKLANGSNTDMLKVQLDNASTGADYRSHCSIRNIHFFGNRSNLQNPTDTTNEINSSGNGIVLSGVRYVTLENVIVTKCADDGLKMQSHTYSSSPVSTNNIDIRACAFHSNGANGVRLSGGDSIMHSCTVGYNGTNGIIVAGFGIISNSLVWDNFDNGIFVQGSLENVTIVGNKIYDNDHVGIYLDDTDVIQTATASIAGNKIIRNGGNSSSVGSQASGIFINTVATNELVINGNEIGNTDDLWDTSKSYTTGNRVINSGRLYIATASISSGGSAPTHTSGTTNNWEEKGTVQDYGIYFNKTETIIRGFAGNEITRNFINNIFTQTNTDPIVLEVPGNITGTGDLTIDTNTLHVDSSNNRVGIGTTSPATPLEVRTSSDTEIAAIRTGSIASKLGAFANGESRLTSAGNNGFWTFYTGTSSVERMRIDTSGHLLFAGTSEEITLQTSDGSDNGYLNLSGGGACNQNRGAQLVLNGNERSGLLGTCQLMAGNAGSASSVIQFFTGGSEQARIDASGRLLVGTTDTPSKLTVDTDFCVVRSSSDPTINLLLGSSSSITKLYRILIDDSDSDKLQVRDNDTPRITLDTSGKVGIGTSSPQALLSLRTASVALGSNGHIYIQSTDAGADIGGQLNFGNNNARRCAIAGRQESSDAIAGYLQFGTRGTTGDITERMRIDSSGNVGIGTTSPTYTNALFGGSQRTFHLSGTAAPQLRIQSSTSGQADLLLQAGNSGSTAYIANAASGGDLFFSTNNGGSQGTRFAIKDDGKVGIGTTSPSTLLELSGSGNAILTVNTGNNSGDNSQIAFGDSADADVGFINYDHGTNVMQFRVNGSERMRINSVGQLQIGDTTAADTSEMLKVDGAGASDHCGIGVKTSNNVHDGYIAFHDSDANFRGQVRYDHSVDAMFFNTAATERVRIDSSGNVGIGGTAPNYQLHVVSSIGIGSHGFAQQISISNQRIQSLLLGTGYRTLILNGLGGDIVMGSGTTQRFAFGTNDGLKYAGFGPAHGAAQDVGLNFFTTSNAGTTFVNHFRIDHNGDLFGTDTSISSISDSRVKTNITNYTYDLTKFKQFTPKQFDWKNPEYHGEKTNLKGFLAQDLEAIDTQWVGSSFIQKDNPDYDLVDKSKDGEDEDVGVAKTSKFGDKDAMYISVINQMITKIETLETKVAALEAA